jgi:hypothetical protein
MRAGLHKLEHRSSPLLKLVRARKKMKGKHTLSFAEHRLDHLVSPYIIAVPSLRRSSRFAVSAQSYFACGYLLKLAILKASPLFVCPFCNRSNVDFLDLAHARRHANAVFDVGRALVFDSLA